MKRFAILLTALLAALVLQGVSFAADKMPCGMDKADCKMMDKMPCKDGKDCGKKCGVGGMTRPRMNKSCRMPGFYLHNAGVLGVSDVQAESLEKLDEGLRRDMILKGAAVKALEMDLGNIVTKTDFKYDDAAAKLKEIEKARTELRLTVIKASAAARDLLGKEQLDKIKEMGMPGRGYGMMSVGDMDDQDDDDMDMPGMGGMSDEMMKGKMMENMRERMMQQGNTNQE